MSSQRRIQASRDNGAKSRGPVTPEGKHRSSRNGIDHGLLANTIVLDDEDTLSFHTLLSSMERSLCPQDEFEADCVLSLTVARWRAMRVWAMEHATLQNEISKLDNPATTPSTRAALAFRSLSERSNAFELLGRYETRFDRQYARAFNTLLKKRKFPSEPSPKTGQSNPKNHSLQE